MHTGHRWWPVKKWNTIFNISISPKVNDLKNWNYSVCKSSTEYKANAFTSHILIDTDEYLNYARNGFDVVQLTSAMNSKINRMLMELNGIGYNLKSPMKPRSNCFKKRA